jgi:hypothetical protein
LQIALGMQVMGESIMSGLDDVWKRGILRFACLGSLDLQTADHLCDIVSPKQSLCLSKPSIF